MNWRVWFGVLVAGAVVLGVGRLGLAEDGGKIAEKRAKLDKDSKLVGWWKFDEVSGKTASGSSRQRRKGELRGGMTFEKNSGQGRIGRALRFEGGDDWVEVVGYKGVVGTRARTVTAWIRTKRARGEIISWGQEEFGKLWVFGFVRGRIGVTPHGGYLYMRDALHDGKWHHVAVVVREAELPNLHDDVRLYKDGEPAEIHDIGLLDLWPIQTGKELNVRIGRGFEGLIDDVRVYERALTEDEIGLLFKFPAGSDK